MKKKLSFIIPVYNVEKYLNECVDSILGQLTDECEIILVDDGAKDNSGLICDEYANKDKRIKVIHQVNGGLAAARNTGLNYAIGDYIAFVDSDDYIANGSVCNILAWIEKSGADICFMKAKKVFPDGSMQLLDQEIDSSELGKGKEPAIRYLSKQPKFPGSPCTKLFRKELLDKTALRFPDDRRVSEDLGFVLRCILEAQSYDSLMMDYYYYRQGREGSITNTFTYKSFLGLKMFVEESVELLTKNKKAKGICEQYMMSFVAYEYSIMIWQYKCMDSAKREDALGFLKAYNWVLQYGVSKKTRLIYAMTRIVGIKTCANILDFYMKHR